jgi:hypothetical protein
VQSIVMVLAQRQEQGEIGWAAVLPELDVVRLAVGHVPVAPGHAARSVHRSQRTPLIA